MMVGGVVVMRNSKVPESGTNSIRHSGLCSFGPLGSAARPHE
jgi:hypothetical protein